MLVKNAGKLRVIFGAVIAYMFVLVCTLMIWARAVSLYEFQTEPLLNVPNFTLKSTAGSAEGQDLPGRVLRIVPRGATHRHSNMPDKDPTEFFRNVLQEEDKEHMRKMLQTFDKVMTMIGATYIMYAGTLIGSYRHHGFIPWDDDADVMVPSSQMRAVYNAFKDNADYELNIKPVHYWKLYPKAGTTLKGIPWKYPFVDIFFYHENATHIWDAHPQYTETYVYRKAIIFPLRRRPFMDLLLLAPSDPGAVINKTYDIDSCVSPHWIHKYERRTESKSVACGLLHSKFPFVHRQYVKGSCYETLQFNGTILSLFCDRGIFC